MCCTRESQGALETCECSHGGHGMFVRRFVSAKEERARLEEYRDQLKNELAGVEERIQELKGK